MSSASRLVAALAATAALGLVACGGSSGSAAKTGCDGGVREALDPNLSHVLVQSGDTEPKYLTDPPTSGPHSPGAKPAGVAVVPLSKPVQVGALEAGLVLVQYRDPADLDALKPLGTGSVVVAPNPTLGARVVATSWLFKLTCSSIDTAAITAFATQHAGHGPGADG